MENQLLQCPLFKGVSEEGLSGMFDVVEHKIQTYKKDEIITGENELCNRLMIILAGTVRGEMTDYTGKVIKIEDIGIYRPLAPAFLFGRNNRFPVSIMANENVKILSISKEEVLIMFQKNERFLLNFLNLISNRTQFLSQKIKFLSFQTIKGKLAHFFLQIDIRKKSELITLPVSQKEMAELFGVTRPALGRALREMDRDGLIEASGKNIRIVDYKKLEIILR